MEEGGTSENNEKEKQEDPVRFRRWIAMTPDSKWREFRGTAGMVDVGRGNDLVDLVDKMMTARLLMHAQMAEGWLVMRTGLTPLNAGWIFSEMIAGMESLQKFEIENFTTKNSWASSKKREAFPRYLSDLPVKDGTVEQKEMPMTAFEKRMEMLFGGSLPNGFKSDMWRKITIAEIATEARLRREKENSNQPIVQNISSVKTNAMKSSPRHTRSSSVHTTNRDPVDTPILKSTRANQCRASTSKTVCSSNQVETPILTSRPFPREDPIQAHQLNPKKVCSGIGIIIERNGKPTITVNENYKNNRKKDNKTQPLETSSRIPSFMAMNSNGKTSESKLMTVLVTQNTKGEIISCEYAPVTFADAPQTRKTNAYPIEDYPDEMLDFTVPDTDERQPSTRRNWIELSNALAEQKSLAESKRSPSDSGLSSTSEAVNLSTGTCTPVASESGSLSNQIGSSSTVSQIIPQRSDTPESKSVLTASVLTEKEEPSNSNQVTTLPSYASVVCNKVSLPNDRNNTLGSTASHVAMTDNPVRRNETKKKKEGDTVTSQKRNEEKRVTDKDNWTLVKAKNAVESDTVSSPTTSMTEWPLLNSTLKERKPEKPNSMMTVAENWDNVMIDEEVERQQELKRLKKQKQRAARIEKEKEEKRLQRLDAERVENQENENAPVAVSENPIRVVALLPIPIIVLTEPFCAPKEEEEKEKGSYDPVTGIYSDGHIFHEYEDEEDTSDKNVQKDPLFLVAEKHAKIVFRLMWFDNVKKLEKMSIDGANKRRLQDSIDMIRAMQERIDIAGQMIVYRIAHPKMSSMKELNIVSIARNLIDTTRHTLGNDVIMAKSLSHIIGEEKIMKNLVYEKYIHTILTLPTDFIPKLPTGNNNARTYKEITMLATLFTKRVDKVYEEICGLYEFEIVKDRKRSRRGY